MKSKTLFGIAAGAFILATELLFFWLIPTETGIFIATYPFYACMSIGHVCLLFYVVDKYKHPASFAPSIIGSIITALYLSGVIVMGMLSTNIRTCLFIEGIGVVIYIFAMTLLIGFASKDSVDSNIPDEPVRPYTSNPGYVAAARPVSSARRLPKAVNDDSENL